MIKKSSRIKYAYCGEQLNIKEIYSRNKKRRGRLKYLLSVDVMVGKNHIKGPRKRTEDDDVRFAQSFEKLILMAKSKEGAQSGTI